MNIFYAQNILFDLKYIMLFFYRNYEMYGYAYGISINNCII